LNDNVGKIYPEQQAISPHHHSGNRYNTSEQTPRGEKKRLTTQAKTTTMAKAGDPVPSCKPIATARAVTVAECEDGIPPESSILLESHLFSLNLSI
jgi:hypothetical protein